MCARIDAVGAPELCPLSQSVNVIVSSVVWSKSLEL